MLVCLKFCNFNVYSIIQLLPTVKVEIYRDLSILVISIEAADDLVTQELTILPEKIETLHGRYDEYATVADPYGQWHIQLDSHKDLYIDSNAVIIIYRLVNA